MTWLTDITIDHLRRQGYVVGTRDEVIQSLRSEGMHVSQLAPAADLKAQGYRVFAPEAPPRIGSVWASTRGISHARTVLRTPPGIVVYGTQGALEACISLRAWHRWRTRQRAVEVKDAQG